MDDGDMDMDLLLALAEEAEEEWPATSGRLGPAPASSQQASTLHKTSTSTQPALARTVSAAPVAPLAPATTAPPPGSYIAPMRTLPTQQPSQRPGQSHAAGGKRGILDGYVCSVSRYRVSKPVIGSLVLKERLTDEDVVYLALKDISPNRELAGRWATMAVLVGKVQATGRDGSSYCRWTLSDLAGKQVTLFLWRKAASDLYKEAEGSLLLLWSPQVKRDDGGRDGPGFSLHVDKPECVQRPGVAADFAMCKGVRKDGQRCNNPVNVSACEYCPYHAQAALRALSSSRPDMAGANLLQRQLLPQARAAQKQMGAPAGINHLLARPMPRAVPGHRQGGAAASAMGGASAALASGAVGASQSQRGMSTGAYGFAEDYGGGSGMASAAAGGAAGTGTGGGGSKRSYGSQLLQLQRQVAAAMEGGETPSGPAAKRQRADGGGATPGSDAWDHGHVALTPATGGRATASESAKSAARARALAAARAAGHLTSQSPAPGATAPQHPTPPSASASRPGGPTPSPAPTPGTRVAPSSVGRSTSASASTRAAPLPAILRAPPPLPPSLQALFQSGGSGSKGGGNSGKAAAKAGLVATGKGGGGGTVGSEAGVKEGPAAVRKEQHRQQQSKGPGSAEGAGAGAQSKDGDEVVQRGGCGAEGKAGGGGEKGGREAKGSKEMGADVMEMEEDELVVLEDGEEEGVAGGEREGEAGSRGCQEELDQGDELVVLEEEEEGGEAVAGPAGGLGEGEGQGHAPSEKQQHVERPEAAAPAKGVASNGRQGSQRQREQEEGQGKEDKGEAEEEDGGGLDDLLALFPEEELLAAQEDAQGQGEEQQQQQGRGLDLHNRAEQQGQGEKGGRGTVGAGVSRPQVVVAAGGRAAAVAAAAGSGPAVTGLLPRVAGLSATLPPSARAAEQRKQQAAAAKARSEKLKALGMAAPKPLAANNGVAAAAAAGSSAMAQRLSQLPQGRKAAGGAGGKPAGGGGGAAAAAAGPSSALAAAFASIVQEKLPLAAASGGVESRYTELSEDAAGEAVISMLESLEAKDALVQQLDSVSHLKVSAWHCAQCERLFEFQDKQCRADGHVLTRTSTLKRFWSCDHCNARITTLGVRFPNSRCSRCNHPSLEFTACTMYRGPRELKTAAVAASSGVACKENLYATIESHPEMGKRTFR